MTISSSVCIFLGAGFGVVDVRPERLTTRPICELVGGELKGDDRPKFGVGRFGGWDTVVDVETVGARGVT